MRCPTEVEGLGTPELLGVLLRGLCVWARAKKLEALRATAAAAAGEQLQEGVCDDGRDMPHDNPTAAAARMQLLATWRETWASQPN